MRDSGVEWIGEIPEGWSTCRMGPNFYMKGRIGWQGLKSDDFIDEGPCLITGTDFDNGTVDWSRCYHISQERFDEDPAIHVQEDDVLFTKDGTVGKLAYVDRNPGQASLNSHLLLIRGFDKARTSQRFLFWVLQSDVFTRFKLLVQHGSVMDSISQTDMRHFIYPLPDIEEQERIAHQLDGEVAEVEAASSTASHQIDVLRRYRESLIHEAVTKGLDPSVPMKPSGVKWIGDIPEGWATTKIRYISTSRNGLDYTGEDLCSNEDDCAVLVIRAANITEQGSLALKDNVYVNMSIDPKLMVRRGDIAIVRTNGSRRLVGKSALIMDDLRATVGGFMLLCRSPYSRYLYWLLHSNLLGYYMGQFDSSTVSQLPHRVFENMMVPFCPDAHERDAICDYLDSKCLVIDRAIDLKEHQLDVLKRRRQSLIYEYVTGKRRVR